MTCAALVLAAGMSRRMGSANKLLLDIEGRPLIRRVLEAAQASKAARVRVVLGHEAKAVRAAVLPYAAPHVEFVTNTDYRSGLASSLQCGLDGLAEVCAGVAVCLGDMPWLRAELIDALCAALRPGDYAAVPVWEGQWGHPVVLSAAAARDAGALSGDRGARSLLLGRAARVREVPAPSGDVLRDIDRRRDLELC